MEYNDVFIPTEHYIDYEYTVCAIRISCARAGRLNHSKKILITEITFDLEWSLVGQQSCSPKNNPRQTHIHETKQKTKFLSL